MKKSNLIYYILLFMIGPACVEDKTPSSQVMADPPPGFSSATHNDESVVLNRYKLDSPAPVPVLVSGGRYFPINCGEHQEAFINGMGYNYDFLKFTEPETVDPTSFSPEKEITCSGGGAELSFADVNGKRSYFVMDFSNSTLYVLGCRGLLRGFGFDSHLDAQNNEGLFNIPGLKAVPINCYEGRPVAADKPEFTNTPAIEMVSGNIVSVPLEVLGAESYQTVSYSVEATECDGVDLNRPAKPFWSHIGGENRDQLIVGAKPSSVDFPPCRVTVKADIEGSTSEPFTFEVTVTKESIARVVSKHGTTCSYSTSGQGECWGRVAMKINGSAGGIENIAISRDTVCLQLAKSSENIQCSHGPEVSAGARNATVPGGRALEITANGLYFCGLFDNSGDQTADYLQCWGDMPISDISDEMMPLDSPKNLASTMTTVCFDSPDPQNPTARSVKCIGSNTMETGATFPKKEEGLFNVNLDSVEDIALVGGGGCYLSGGKLGCWGDLAALAEDQKDRDLIALEAGTQMLCAVANEDNGHQYYCREGGNPSSHSCALEKDISISNEGFNGPTRVCSLDTTGGGLRCRVAGSAFCFNAAYDFKRSIEDINPHTAYWKQQL